MANLDLKKDLKHLYNPSSNSVSVVDVPTMHFLMIDGKGDPNTAPEYPQAVSALYTLAYGIRKIVKDHDGTTFTVMPLEGLWWAEDMSAFSVDAKSDWLWTMMILQPDLVTAEMVSQALASASKKKDAPEKLSEIRFEAFTEDKAVQIMHIGPYSAEQPNVQRLHDYIHENGYKLSGKHHEIYLSDPNRTEPEKMKTVIRQPFQS